MQISSQSTWQWLCVGIILIILSFFLVMNIAYIMLRCPVCPPRLLSWFCCCVHFFFLVPSCWNPTFCCFACNYEKNERNKQQKKAPERSVRLLVLGVVHGRRNPSSGWKNGRHKLNSPKRIRAKRWRMIAMLTKSGSHCWDAWGGRDSKHKTAARKKDKKASWNKNEDFSRLIRWDEMYVEVRGFFCGSCFYHLGVRGFLHFSVAWNGGGGWVLSPSRGSTDWHRLMNDVTSDLFMVKKCFFPFYTMQRKKWSPWRLFFFGLGVSFSCHYFTKQSKKTFCVHFGSFTNSISKWDTRCWCFSSKCRTQTRWSN